MEPNIEVNHLNHVCNKHVTGQLFKKVKRRGISTCKTQYLWKRNAAMIRLALVAEVLPPTGSQEIPWIQRALLSSRCFQHRNIPGIWHHCWEEKRISFQLKVGLACVPKMTLCQKYLVPGHLNVLRICHLSSNSVPICCAKVLLHCFRSWPQTHKMWLSGRNAVVLIRPEFTQAH